MRRAALLALAAGCSTSPAKTTINTFVWGTPTLIAYQDGSGKWQEPSLDPAGNYELQVGDMYQLVVVCSDSTGFTTRIRQRTVADGDDFVWCMNHGDPYTTVPVTGHVQQAGFVSFYDYASSTTAPWDFSLAVTPGLHDLGAYANGKIVFTHDILVQGATTMEPIDVDRSGVALLPIALQVGGLAAADQLATETDVYTQNDIVTAPLVTGASAMVPPSSALAPADQLDFFITATNGSVTRTADTWFTGTQKQFTLPPPLQGVTFQPRGATTPQLADEQELELVQSGTGYTNTEDVTATTAWLDGNTSVSVDLPSYPDRFQQAWTIDATKPYTRTFGLRTLGEIVYTSQVTDSPTAMARAGGSFRTRLRYSDRSTGR